MDDYACAALNLTNVNARNCAQRCADLLREEIGGVQGACGIGQRRVENARDAGRFKRRAELGPVRAVPTYNLVEMAEFGRFEISDTHKIDSSRCNRTSPCELNQRQNCRGRPDFRIAG
jgi:hypothetical protein